MLVNSPRVRPPNSSAKHCRAVANQPRAGPSIRNAPAKCVRPTKRGCRHGGDRVRGRHGRWDRRGGNLTDAELLEEVVQGNARDTDAKGSVDESDQVRLGGVGMGKAELDDRPGITGQKFAVGPSIQTMVRLLYGLLGSHALLPRGGGPADAEQAGECSDLQTGITMEQEMGEQARGVGVVALVLTEAEEGKQDAALIGRETVFDDLSLGQPVGERRGGGLHRSPSRATTQEVVYSVAGKG